MAGMTQRLDHGMWPRALVERVAFDRLVERIGGQFAAPDQEVIVRTASGGYGTPDHLTGRWSARTLNVFIRAEAAMAPIVESIEIARTP